MSAGRRQTWPSRGRGRAAFSDASPRPTNSRRSYRRTQPNIGAAACTTNARCIVERTGGLKVGLLLPVAAVLAANRLCCER